MARNIHLPIAFENEESCVDGDTLSSIGDLSSSGAALGSLIRRQLVARALFLYPQPRSTSSVRGYARTIDGRIISPWCPYCNGRPPCSIDRQAKHYAWGLYIELQRGDDDEPLRHTIACASRARAEAAARALRDVCDRNLELLFARYRSSFDA